MLCFPSLLFYNRVIPISLLDRREHYMLSRWLADNPQTAHSGALALHELTFIKLFLT